MIQVLNNRLWGVSGALEINIPAANQTHIVRGNILKPAPGYSSLILLEIKNNTASNSTILVENNEITGHQRVGMFSSRSRNVILRNNVFSPDPVSSEFIHLAVNTKYQSAANEAPTFCSILVKGNQFLGGSAGSGTGILFQNHASGVYPAFQNTEIGGPGAEANEFGGAMKYHFFLDTASGPSSKIPFWLFSGSPVTTMHPVSQDFDIQQNKFDAGAGLKAPGAMGATEWLNLEDKIAHGVDHDSLGFVTVVPKRVFATDQSYLAPVYMQNILARAIREVKGADDWTMMVRSGLYPGSSTVTTALLVEWENAGTSVATDNFALNAPGKQLIMNTEIAIAGNLSLLNGLMILNNADVRMLASASLTGAGTSSYVQTNGTGLFRYAGLNGSSRSYPVGNVNGYFPVTLSNSGTPDDFGVRALTDVFANGTSGATVNGVINPSYIFHELVAGGSNLNVAISWAGSQEKPGFDRSKSTLQGYNGSWTDLAGPVSATGSNPYSATFSNATGTFTSLAVRIGNSVVVPPSCSFAVVCHQQGLTHGGGPVPAERSNLNLATTAQKSDANGPVNFYTLGFGGSITLRSSCPVANGPGNDIKVWETTFGAQIVNAYSDRARVYASQDGINFGLLGVATFDAAFNLDAAGLAWAQYFKVVDITTDSPSNPPSADAFDLEDRKSVV